MLPEKLEQLLGTERLTDLVLNGAHQTFALVDGAWITADNPFESSIELQEFAVGLASESRKRLDYGQPFADVAYGNLRFHLSLPLGTNPNINVSIRKHSITSFDLATVVENPTRWLPILTRIIRERANFIISGGTGSGKTTLLRSMFAEVPGERIVCVEDVAELELPSPNVVSLQTRQANSDGFGQIDLQRLVVESLRMKPDRILIGEVRGIELVPMLQALNSGHQGSATTIHANRAEDVPARLVGIGLLGGLSPATTANLAASAFRYVISLGERQGAVRVNSISSLTLTNENKLVVRHEY
jgi:pilus assembly protein CpaF